ncbi:MAG: PPC domain-containing protein, partial [Planctomycetaceae bacterium]
TSGGDRFDAGIGDNSFDTRVDAYSSWIDSIVGDTSNPDPNPNPDPPADDHVNEPGEGATVITLSDGSGSATGTLEQAGDRDVFSVTLGADSATTIALSATGNGLDTFLRIYDSNGSLIAENDDVGESLNSGLTEDLSAGTYYIQAGSYQDGGTGDYSVSVVAAAAPNPDPDPDPDPPSDDHVNVAGPDATVISLDADGVGNGSGTLEVAGDRDVFSVELTAGTLTVDATSTNGDVDMYLRLLDSSGNIIAENDDFDGRLDSSLTLDLEAGTYYISVGSYADAGAGAFTVSVRHAAAATPLNGQEYFFSTQWGGTLTGSDGSTIETTGSDIVRLVVMEDGSFDYNLYFDGSDVGLSGGAENVDAFTILEDGSILVSTWRRARVPGVNARPEDLLRFTPDSLGEDTAGSWSMYFDGGDTGLRGRRGNIDGVSVLDTGQLILSTHGRQRLGGDTVNREDLVIFTPGNLGNYTSGNYRVYFDGSDVALRGGRENIDAVDVTDNGLIHLSTRGQFAVQGGLTGGNSDIFSFSGTNLTRYTRGIFQ